jgi:hypothetical protein
MWRARLIAALVSPLRDEAHDDVAALEIRALLDPDPDAPPIVGRSRVRTRYRWPHRMIKPKP